MNDLSNKHNVTQLLKKRIELTNSYVNRGIRFEFDERYLYETWMNRYSKGSKHYLLHDLSPKLTKWTQIEESSIQKVKWGSISFVLAAVVFFSTYNIKLPLLAPILLGVGIFALALGISNILPKSWTYIYDDDGNYVSSISIDRKESKEQKQSREIFESQLILAIEKAKQQEYYE